MERNVKLFSVLVWFLLNLLSSSAFGQGSAATGLRGRVIDPLAAPVPGVEITIARTATGERRQTVSDENGDWEARFLSAGIYELTLEMQGFKTQRLADIPVESQEMTTLDTSLELGELREVIEVVSTPNLVSSGSATLMKELSLIELDQLPSSSRNFTQLLSLEPGVSANITDLVSNDNASVSPSVNGARSTNNNLVFNGISVTNLLCCNSRVNGSDGTLANGGGSLSRNIAPAPETLQEVKIQTALFDAETGRKGGGNFQLVSRSGTNDFHGSAYWYHQNDNLMANDFFFNRASAGKPSLLRNEGGFTFGGPLVKDRTFFFGSYQVTRAKTSFVNEASNTVRLPGALTDDRSDAGIEAFATALGVESPEQINPTSRALLQARFPDGSHLVPSGSSGFNCGVEEDQSGESCQVLSVIPATYHQDQFTFNLDHQFAENNRFSGRLFFADQPSIDPLTSGESLSRFEQTKDTDQVVLSLSDTHIFSPSVINEFRAGFFRNRNDRRPKAYFTNQEFSIDHPLTNRRSDLAIITIEGEDVGSELTFGTPGPDNSDVQNTFSYADTLSFRRGAHSFRFGGDYSRTQLNGTLQEVMNGQFGFESWSDFLTVGSGDAEQIAETSLNYGETIRGYRISDYSVFFLDDWKVSPNLTLNLGLRWDLFGHPWEVNGFLNNYDLNAALATGNVMDGFVFASNFNPANLPGATGASLRFADNKSTLDTDLNNLAPRLGLAWAPWPNRKLVVRAGYGIFYERTSGAFANSLRQAAPWFREGEIEEQGDWNSFPGDPSAFPYPEYVIGFDDGEPFLASANDPDEEFEALEAQMIPTRIATPYIQQWSLNTQWELFPGYLLEIGYVGTKGTKLLQFVNANSPLNVDVEGFLARPGVPGGGFSTNFFETVDDEFVPVATPPCDVFDDPDDCTIAAELRAPLLGFDEDEGVNMAMTNSNSTYHGLQVGLERRFTSDYMFNLNYTFSKSIDDFSDEGRFQVEHDNTRLWLNRGLSDFDRTHRFTFSWVWELPFKANRLVRGWSLTGIGTFQSGTPLSIIDDDYSGFLFASDGPRPNLAPGASLADIATPGSVNSRIDGYFDESALESSGPLFGNLGRNIIRGPGQRRVDLALIKRTSITESAFVEFRSEFFNLFNMTSFRNPENDLSSGDFGEITETRGGPRVIQLGLKLVF